MLTARKHSLPLLTWSGETAVNRLFGRPFLTFGGSLQQRSRNISEVLGTCRTNSSQTIVPADLPVKNSMPEVVRKGDGDD